MAGSKPAVLASSFNSCQAFFVLSALAWSVTERKIWKFHVLSGNALLSLHKQRWP